jgi:hypothetical protein
MSYFKDAKVGDKVWDLVWGEGEISKVNICPEFESRPITAIFKYNYCDVETIEYSLHGKHSGTYEKENQRLFYYDNRPIVITQDNLEIPKDSKSYYLSVGGSFMCCTDSDRHFGVDSSIDIKRPQKLDKYTRKIHREAPESEYIEGRDYNIKPTNQDLKIEIEELKRRLEDTDKRVNKIDEKLK